MLHFWTGYLTAGSTMSMFSQFACFILNLLLCFRSHFCTEIDFCQIVQLDSARDSSSGGTVLKISAFNEDFYLKLLPDSSFLAPDATYESHPSHASPTASHLRRCFYSGDVNSDSSSYAAVSLCGGMRGAFSYNGMEYLFQPRSSNHTTQRSSSSSLKTHIIHATRSPHHSTSRCGVASTPEHGIAESLEKYKHLTAKNLTETMPRSMTRSKRFASLPRYVEVLVVADDSMAKFHGDNLKHYLLTLMSVAAKLYKHPSIFNFINIVVVKIMVITELEKGPKVSSNAALTLRNFCSWQKKLNKVNDKHPEYWDTAILFTKQDLCGANTCDTLGMADVGTICDPKRSCSVIEDDGLPSAFTTAHELGKHELCEEPLGCLYAISHSTKQQYGRWGKWGAYGSCSRTCGGGVQLAKRLCNNPVPENGGKYCQGLRVKYRSCNLDPCKSSGKSFREEQCEAYNGFNLNTNRLGSSVVWVPKYSGVSPKDRCKLICRANGTGYFYVLAPKVVDGTLCSPDTSALCVQGKCIKAGCDGRLSSNLKFDKCGVCGGDNQNCRKLSGVFTKPIHGYNFVITLPVGASNVDVRQRGYRGLVNDDNYLAIKNTHGRYLLNGNYVVSAVEKDIIVKGSLLRYSGTSSAVETLQATRPLQEPLTVEVLSVGKMTPPRVRYSYYLAKDKKEENILKKEEKKHAQNSILEDSNKVELKKPAYQKPSCKWETSDWERCSVSCGKGVQKRLVQCLDSNGKASTHCDSNQKPTIIRVCGDPCPMWSVGEWSSCSKSCGKGFKRRPLRCITHSGLHLPRDQCSGKRKPQELDFCMFQTC
uniref:ADAM metallopeptidase with thrombospondin type 1 motif, 15b n=1 Tax=Astyanax mexicanus TaxID=7994 RepID=A0A8B9HBF8_ASTMX